MQSLFEGAMYTFVFLWTPALSPQGEHLPHGMIFACFMVSSMAGSALAGCLLANHKRFRPERYMQVQCLGLHIRCPSIMGPAWMCPVADKLKVHAVRSAVCPQA